VRKKVLVVDDSKTAILIQTTLLRRADFEIATASDGSEALQKALDDPPDLILMDVLMPRMDGYDACRELKRHPSTRDIPVILVTTRGEEENVTAGYLSGCADYVTKPVDGVELLAKVRNCLGEGFTC